MDDLPAIRGLSESMDIRNDPKIGEIAESIMKNPNCVLYGAFEKGSLVGVGGLRDKGRRLAWIESIRVHGDHQRSGVGTALIRHGEELARKQEYLRVAYQTVTANESSCRIGAKLGFQRKHEMVAFYSMPADIPEVDKARSAGKLVTAHEALDVFERIPNGPKDEICIGWSYAPLDADFLDSNPDMDFYVQGETAMMEYQDRNPNTEEVESVRAILYGAQSGIRGLLTGFIMRNARRNLPLISLCPEELTSEVSSMGFQYATVWTGGNNIVVLFTKDLH